MVLGFRNVQEISRNHTPLNTNMTVENPPWMKMYFLLKMGIFQPVMLVNSGGVADLIST